jgi:hypothetical protein
MKNDKISYLKVIGVKLKGVFKSIYFVLVTLTFKVIIIILFVFISHEKK